MQSNTRITNELLHDLEEQFDAEAEVGYTEKPRYEEKRSRQDTKRIDKSARKQIKKERRQKKMFQEMLTEC